MPLDAVNGAVWVNPDSVSDQIPRFVVDLARQVVVEFGSARVVIDPQVDDNHLARVLRVVGSVC